jgi:hypothetical protein
MAMQYGYGYGAGYDYYGGYGAYAAYGYPPRGMGYPMGGRGMRGGGRFPARGGRFGFRGGRGMGGGYMQPGGQPGESSGLQVRHQEGSSSSGRGKEWLVPVLEGAQWGAQQLGFRLPGGTRSGNVN